MMSMLLMAPAAEGLLDVSRSGSSPDLVAYDVRCVFRRDWPTEGEHTFAFIPQSQTGDLLLDCGNVSARAIRILPHADPSRCLLVWTRPEPQILNWTAFTARWRSSFISLNIEEKFAAVEQLTRAPSYADAVGGETSYVVLSLRKCHRGGPLLPVSRTDSDDSLVFEAESVVRPFGEYLIQFFAFFGVCEPRVFDSIDGWRVAPYQAVVQKAFWSEARSMFE